MESEVIAKGRSLTVCSVRHGSRMQDFMYRPLTHAASYDRSVLRTRSDSSPLRGTAAKSADETGNAHLSRRWRSWSFPHQGIPLGSLTAREAARPFWNKTMLQQRLEKIAECVLLEAPASPTDSESDIEFSLDVDALDLEQNLNSRPTAERTTTPTMDSESDDDNVGGRRGGGFMASSPLVIVHTAGHYSREQSTTDTESTGEELAVKSAPSLHFERNNEPFPIAIFSQSTSVL